MTDADAIGRLRRLLGGEDSQWLLERMRARLQARGELTGTITKQQATTPERVAVARMLGRSVTPGRSASVSLDALDEKLRRSGAWPDGLTSAVVALTGEVVGPETRRAEREAWQRANDVLHELARDRPEISAWAASVQRAGSLKRLAPSADSAFDLAERLLSVARELPVDGGESLAVFAARTLGDAHALDAKTALGTLATGLTAAMAGNELAAVGSTPGTAQWRRDAWQAVGIVVDELSSTVLALGLPGGGGSPTAQSLESLGSAGQPVILTLRQVLRDDIGSIPPVVAVCENPSVVAAAAEQLGASSAPVVCLNGQPGAAAIRLLRQLVAGGARLRYHGDFDAGGLLIARTLARHVSWEPWRFGASDYLDACESLGNLSRFTGSVGETPWDPSLAEAMRSTGLRVEEEAVIDALLADLAEDT